MRCGLVSERWRSTASPTADRSSHFATSGIWVTWPGRTLQVVPLYDSSLCCRVLCRPCYDRRQQHPHRKWRHATWRRPVELMRPPGMQFSSGQAWRTTRNRLVWARPMQRWVESRIKWTLLPSHWWWAAAAARKTPISTSIFLLPNTTVKHYNDFFLFYFFQ